MRNSGRSASLKSDSQRSISFEAPSDIGFVRKASRKVIRYLAPLSLDGSLLFDIRLSVEEAIRNAIVHGNRSDRRLRVKISCSIDNNILEVVVEDQGKGFDPGRVPDPTEEENLMKGAGRGVYLIKHFMDRVEYNSKGSIIKMTKNLKV